MAKKRRHYGRGTFAYRSYNFKGDKDPVIFDVEKIMKREGLSHADVQALSHVSSTTVKNWTHGATRRPQNTTLEAVIRGMGYKRVMVRDDAYGNEHGRELFERDINSGRKEFKKKHEEAAR